MTKTLMSVSIDSDIARMIKSRFRGNISSVVERTFKAMLDQDLPDMNGKTTEEIDQEISAAEKRRVEASAEYNHLVAAKELSIKKTEEQQKKDLDIKQRMVKGFRISGGHIEAAKYD